MLRLPDVPRRADIAVFGGSGFYSFLAEKLGHAPILVVTDTYHVWRCERVFRVRFDDAQGRTIAVGNFGQQKRKRETNCRIEAETNIAPGYAF